METERRTWREDFVVDDRGVKTMEKRTSGCNGGVVAKRATRQNWRLTRHGGREKTTSEYKSRSENDVVKDSEGIAHSKKRVARDNQRSNLGEGRRRRRSRKRHERN